MNELLSIVSLMLLLVAQAAVVMSESGSAIISVLIVHLVAMAISAGYWLRKNRSCVPPYTIATVISNHPEGGKVLSTERDSLLIGSGVAGVFFGWPVISRLIEFAEPTPVHALVMFLVVITPASVYINWYFLRRFLWMSFPLLLGWSLWTWLMT